jgi:type IV pilus assembly protein PilP
MSKKTLRRQKRNKIKFLSLLLVFFFPVLFTQAEASIVYKEPRPLKGGGPMIESKVVPMGAYIYDPTGKTDPFKSFINDGDTEKKPSTGTELSVLETLDLSQLELIAIMVGPRGNWAMVRDSKGVGHVIQKGKRIGTKGGVVDKITEHEVIIKEEFKDFRGNKQYKEVVKKIPSPLL